MSGQAGYNRGGSKQNYATPECLMAPIRRRFGAPVFDLAADALNTKAPEFYSEQDDSLSRDWAGLPQGGPLWLNPPFDNIAPWAEKCAETTSRKILLLVPASVGSNWFRDYVFDREAAILFLNGRVPFDPEHPKWGFPKDCMLVAYRYYATYEVWDWRNA